MNTDVDTLMQAEATADRIRTEFWRTLDEIDRRRLEAMDWKHHLKANWKVVAALGGTIVAVIAARMLLTRRAESHASKKLQRERFQTLRRVWEHPERVAPARHSRTVELGSKVVTLLGTAIATQVARKLAKRVIG